MKQFLIIKLIVWLGWLSYIALAQLDLSDAITGAVSFPDVGITVIGNLAAFFTTILRRRLDLENGARDLMVTNIPSTKLVSLKGGNGKSTLEYENYSLASVVMLSMHTSNSSISQFMKYIHDASDVHSILLQCSRFGKEENCVDSSVHKCNCVVFSSEPAIDKMLWPREHGVLINLSNSRWLLRSSVCLGNGCHEACESNNHEAVCLRNGCHEAVCEELDSKSTSDFQEKPICICIPVIDDWTKVLIRSLKSKDQEERGAIVKVSDALERYLAGEKRNTKEKVSYRTASLIVPRLAEISINIVLTVWFKIDGFSSSVVARRAIRNHVVDSKGIGFPASAFLTSAEVNIKCSNVCQVLSFRGTVLSIRTLSSIVGVVNLICSVYWAVFIALDGSAGKWYEIDSILPSKPRVAVIIAAICFGLFMDCWEFPNLKIGSANWVMLLTVIVLEIAFVAVAGVLGLNKGIGRWVYSVMQVLVWVKWGFGSYLLGVYSPDYVPNPSGEDHTQKWNDDGTLLYSSAFLLNAALAGVRGNWGSVRPVN